MIFLHVLKTKRSKPAHILEIFNQRRAHKINIEETIVSKMILTSQQNSYNCKKRIDSQDHSERHCNTFEVFGLNTVKYDINLIKAFSLPILINVLDIELFILKKANEAVSFMFGKVQLLSVFNFFGGATKLDFNLKDCKALETEGFSPHENFNHPDKFNHMKLLSYGTFYNNL